MNKRSKTICLLTTIAILLSLSIIALNVFKTPRLMFKVIISGQNALHYEFRVYSNCEMTVFKRTLEDGSLEEKIAIPREVYSEIISLSQESYAMENPLPGYGSLIVYLMMDADEDALPQNGNYKMPPTSIGSPMRKLLEYLVEYSPMVIDTYNGDLLFKAAPLNDRREKPPSDGFSLLDFWR